MKKKIGVLLLVLTTLVLTCGCEKESGTMTCTNEIKNGNYTTNLKATITYSKKVVDKVVTVEEIMTDEDSKADDFKTLLDNYYVSYNKLEGFTNTVEVKNKKVISKTTIDYHAIDTDALIKIDESNKALIKDGKVALDDLKETYKQQGARCK